MGNIENPLRPLTDNLEPPTQPAGPESRRNLILRQRQSVAQFMQHCQNSGGISGLMTSGKRRQRQVRKLSVAAAPIPALRTNVIVISDARNQQLCAQSACRLDNRLWH